MGFWGSGDEGEPAERGELLAAAVGVRRPHLQKEKERVHTEVVGVEGATRAEGAGGCEGARVHGGSASA